MPEKEIQTVETPQFYIEYHERAENVDLMGHDGWMRYQSSYGIAQYHHTDEAIAEMHQCLIREHINNNYLYRICRKMEVVTTKTVFTDQGIIAIFPNIGRACPFQSIYPGEAKEEYDR